MKNQPTRTVVTYSKGGVTYTHTFSENIAGHEAERRMIMDLHIGRSAIKKISHN